MKGYVDMKSYASRILTCWLHVSELQQTDMNHPRCRVFFLGWFVLFTFTPSSAVSPSAHRPSHRTHSPVTMSRMSRWRSVAARLSPASLLSDGNGHILLHCSSSTCSDRPAQRLRLSLTTSCPQLKVQTSTVPWRGSLCASPHTIQVTG